MRTPTDLLSKDEEGEAGDQIYVHTHIHIHLLLLLKKIIYLKGILRKVRKIFYPLLHCQNACNCQGWNEFKSGA